MLSSVPSRSGTVIEVMMPPYVMILTSIRRALVSTYWSTGVPSSVLPYGRVSTAPAEAVIVRVSPKMGRSDFLVPAYDGCPLRLAREPPDGVPRFRCHVHRLELESTQRPRKDLDACRGRGM